MTYFGLNFDQTHRLQNVKSEHPYIYLAMLVISLNKAVTVVFKVFSSLQFLFPQDNLALILTSSTKRFQFTAMLHTNICFVGLFVYFTCPHVSSARYVDARTTHQNKLTETLLELHDLRSFK